MKSAILPFAICLSIFMRPSMTYAAKRPVRRGAIIASCFMAWRSADSGFSAIQYLEKLQGSIMKEPAVLKSMVTQHPSWSLLDANDQLKTMAKVDDFLKAFQKEEKSVTAFYEKAAMDLKNLDAERINIIENDLLPSPKKGISAPETRKYLQGFFQKHFKSKLTGVVEAIVAESLLNSLGSCLVGHELGYTYKYYKAFTSFCKFGGKFIQSLRSRICRTRGFRSGTGAPICILDIAKDPCFQALDTKGVAPSSLAKPYNGASIYGDTWVEDAQVNCQKPQKPGSSSGASSSGP